MKIRVSRHLMSGSTSCGFDVFVDPDTIPSDRLAKISGGHIMGGNWSKLWQPLVEVILPDGHHDLTPGEERYDQFLIWEKRAKAIERKLVYTAFADTPEKEDPTFLWVEYGVKLGFPALTTVDIEVAPYSHSILLFQEPSGAYQCFLPESVWLARHKDEDCLTRYYSSCQGVELKLVWGMHFLNHEYAGVRVD